jgi:hypothetical protein
MYFCVEMYSPNQRSKYLDWHEHVLYHLMTKSHIIAFPLIMFLQKTYEILLTWH